MRRAMISVITLVLVLTACGGDGDGDELGVGRDVDVCSLVTVAEAADLLGEPLTAEPAEGIDGEPDKVTCLYEGANGIVLLQVYDGEVFFSEPGSASRIGEDVDGLGEDAFWDGDSFQFLQNEWSVSVSQIIGLVDQEMLMEMAQLVSSRLP